MKRNYYCCEGSYTVEAAFVVPFVLGIIFMLMFMFFYEHDKAVVYGVLSNDVCFYEDREVEGEDDIKKELEKNIWFGEVETGEIKQNKLSLFSRAKIKYDINIPIVNYFLDKFYFFEMKISSKRIHPECVVRAKGKKED